MEIRETEDRDIDGIRELFKICFAKELSREEWDWKYKHSPWGSYSVVAVDNGNVVAHYGGIRNKFYFKGKPIYAYQFCDVMTHPKYRAYLFSKTPLVARLNEVFYKEKPMDFAYGFPSPRHTRLQCVRLGGEGYRYVRLYKKNLMKRRMVLLSSGFKEGWEFLENDVIDRFIISYEAPLQLVKDREYLKWRYIDSPRKDYKMGILRRWGMTKGFIVFTLKDDWLNILDVFLKEAKDLRSLLTSLESYTVETSKYMNGIKAWFHPDEIFTKYIIKLGYIGEDDIPYTYRTVNKDCGITSEIFFRYYFYRMGDYDAV